MMEGIKEAMKKRKTKEAIPEGMLKDEKRMSLMDDIKKASWIIYHDESYKNNLKWI